MDFLVKIGDKREQSDPLWEYDWRDGHIIQVRPNEFYDSSIQTLKHFAVLRFTPDFFTSIGASDYNSIRFKSAHPAFISIKKYMYPCDLNGKFPWDVGYIEPEGFTDTLSRLFYFDFESLLSSGWITQTQYDNLYNKDQIVEPISITPTFQSLLKNEIDDPRAPSIDALRAIGTIDAGGTYTVGTSQTYADWSTAVADLPADIGAMTTPGNIILQGNTTEEITESTAIVISLDTDSYSLSLNVHSDHKHNGGAYGNGHRVAFTSFDKFDLDEAGAGTLNGCFIQDMAIDSSGTSNSGIDFSDGFDSGFGVVERCVIAGDANDIYGINVYANAENSIIRNNVCYGHNSYGISLDIQFGITECFVMNNTCCKNGDGIFFSGGGSTSYAYNNLCYGNNTEDFDDDGVDVSAKNVTGDSTSPDGATYQGWTGTANFEDYTNNDFRLASTDSTLDDGDDLSAIGSPEQFSDDIEDQTRSTWYIGAGEYVSGGGAAYPYHIFNQ